ncbi:MAG: LysR family transcriptional regulator [Myxococcota bacterium]|nr:LysR family transcriptional regulator [Myxococcota bacterium]
MSEQEAPITLDQIQVFLCVVEEGSFSGAAKRLRRVQSAISYSIANLERLLEVELFDRSGRKPVLTDAGRALVADAKAVDERVDLLHARAKSISSGVEARLSLAVDMLFPSQPLLDGLRAFNERYPLVDLHLRVEGLGAVVQLVDEGTCQLGIAVDFDTYPRSLTVRPLCTVPMSQVCAPDHALARVEGPIPEDVLRHETQLVVTDRSSLTEGRDRGVVSERTWRIADLHTKRMLLLNGFGWGNMPDHAIANDLEAGRLVRIQPAHRAEDVDVPLSAIARTADPPGPAASWLLDQLAERCA